MEKEPKPFSEEKAKEIMEAEGLEERSQAEQDAFEAGEKYVERKNEQIIEAQEVRLDYEKYIELSKELRDLLKEGDVSIDGNYVRVVGDKITEKLLLECAEELINPQKHIYRLDVEFVKKPILTVETVKRLLEKHPEVHIEGAKYAIEQQDIEKFIQDLKNAGVDCVMNNPPFGSIRKKDYPLRWWDKTSNNQ